MASSTPIRRTFFLGLGFHPVPTRFRIRPRPRRIQSRHHPRAAASVISANCRGRTFRPFPHSPPPFRLANLAIPLSNSSPNSSPGKMPTPPASSTGAPQQDAIDTALILQLRSASTVILSDLDSLSDSLAAIADKHRATPMSPALSPTSATHSFGFIVAAGSTPPPPPRIVALTERTRSCPQFGGAVGTLAALGAHGFLSPSISPPSLSLALPTAPWHSHRDPHRRNCLNCALCAVPSTKSRTTSRFTCNRNRQSSPNLTLPGHGALPPCRTTKSRPSPPFSPNKCVPGSSPPSSRCIDTSTRSRSWAPDGHSPISSHRRRPPSPRRLAPISKSTHAHVRKS